MEINEKIPIAELLPHKEPMILLTDYSEVNKDGTAVAHIDITSFSPFFDHSLGGVPMCVAVEYMAQTMALVVGLNNRLNGIAPRIGYVLGMRHLSINAKCFAPGRRYESRTKCIYADSEFASFDCTILDEENAVVAHAEMNAYQPPMENNEL